MTTTRKPSRKPAAPMKPALDALRGSTVIHEDPFAGMTCQRAAEAFLAAKSKPAKDALVSFVRKRATESARVRWQHLLAAIEAGDNERVRYHASVGEAKREAAKALAATREPKPAKAAAKPTAKAKAAKADPKADAMDALAKALGVPVATVAAMAAFFRAGA